MALSETYDVKQSKRTCVCCDVWVGLHYNRLKSILCSDSKLEHRNDVNFWMANQFDFNNLDYKQFDDSNICGICLAGLPCWRALNYWHMEICAKIGAFCYGFHGRRLFSL